MRRSSRSDARVDIHTAGDGRVRRISSGGAANLRVVLEMSPMAVSSTFRVGGQRVDRGLRAAPAAADQPGLQLLRAGSTDEFRLNERERAAPRPADAVC